MLMPFSHPAKIPLIGLASTSCFEKVIFVGVCAHVFPAKSSRWNVMKVFIIDLVSGSDKQLSSVRIPNSPINSNMQKLYESLLTYRIIL